MMRRASVRRLINIAADITPRGRGVALGESIDLNIQSCTGNEAAAGGGMLMSLRTANRGRSGAALEWIT
ncbi:MAG TPA: hypothetical protein VMS30_02790 [Phycisphaerales bacterium]|jgi:hypothetical protein|nr:hypothetical protein [Phycisphaerales bacterium]